MSHPMLDLSDQDSRDWVVIVPPLGDTRGEVTSRSFVAGEPARSFPSVVLPKLIPDNLVYTWINIDPISTLDVSGMVALVNRSNGAHPCTFVNRITEATLANILFYESYRFWVSSTGISALFEQFSLFRKYTKIVLEVIGDADPYPSSPGVIAKRWCTDAVRAGISMQSSEDFRKALEEVSEVLHVAKEQPSIPGELLDALLTRQWQQNVVTNLRALYYHSLSSGK